MILVLPLQETLSEEQFPSGNPATNVIFSALDIETTGFSPEHDRIVEIGVVKSRNGKIIAQKSWLINPDMPIPYLSKRVHGITDKMVADKPAISNILPLVSRFTADSVIIAHNAQFDLNFMEHEYKRSNITPPENHWLDTLKLSRKWFQESRSHSLKKLLKHLEIPPGKTSHRALADAEHLVKIISKGIEKMGKDVTMEEIFQLHGTPLQMKQSRDVSTKPQK